MKKRMKMMGGLTQVKMPSENQNRERRAVGKDQPFRQKVSERSELREGSPTALPISLLMSS
jgi:hypothetical protein